MDLPYKKRHRIPASCSVCRKRKSKCDRVKPVCGSCKKKSIAHLCFYESDSRDIGDNNKQQDSISQEHNHQGQVGNNPSLPPQLVEYNEQNQQPFQLQQQASNTIQHPNSTYPFVPNESNGSFMVPSGLTYDSNRSGNLYQQQTLSLHPQGPLPVPPQYTPPLQRLSSKQDTEQQYHQLPPQSSPHQNDYREKINLPSLNSNNNSDPQLVSISIAPNSTLQVNPNDSMSVFTNASYSLNVEGPLWQHQGTLSYIGLTKSDPFIKILRSYAILLFKSGVMVQFIKNETMNRKKKSSSTSSPTNVKKAKLDPGSNYNTSASIRSETNILNDSIKDSGGRNDITPKPDDEKKEVDDEPGDVVGEDGLIVTKIKVTKNETNSNADGNKQDNDSPQFFSGLKSLFSGKQTKDDYYNIVEQAILKILPNKKNIFMLFCRFFKYVHPFVSVVDENSLLIDINSVLTERFPLFSQEFYQELSIASDNDLHILGVFLIVLRLGYMSLIHTNPENNQYSDDEWSMIRDMKRVSPENFTNILNLCTTDCNAAKSSFKIVQCLTLLHFYRQVAPDDCHGLGGADSQILLGVIIRHSMSIGLNRDPTYYIAHETISKRPQLIKTWRSLWNYLLIVDATSAIHSGTNLNLKSLEMCDVEFPTFESKTGLLKDTFLNIQTICQSYRNIVNKFNNVHDKPKVFEILLETKHLEKIFFQFFGKDFFKDYICQPVASSRSSANNHIGSLEHEENYLKVIKFSTFIQLRTNLSCMYYMIAIHYENEYNESKTPSMNAGIELFKIYIKSVVQLVYIMSYVLDNSVELFGRNYDHILTANNERCMIKTHNFLTSFFVRLLHHKKALSINKSNDPNIKARLEVIDTLFKFVLMEAELFVGNFRKLSRTYINSYKLYVMIHIILKQCMENPDVFFERTINDKRFYHDGTNMLEFFSINELQYLCKLCEEFRSAKGERTNLLNSRRSSVSSNSSKPIPMTQSSQVNSLNGDNYSASISSVNSTSPPPKSSPQNVENTTIYSNLDNFNELFIDPNTINEELLKLFEVYGDFDKNEF